MAHFFTCPSSSILRTSRAGASGWNDAAVGNVIDIHDYEGLKASKPVGMRASVLGEFGGLGLNLPAHTYMKGVNASSYLMFETAEELNAKYLEYLVEAKRLMLDVDVSLSAIIYTELTDVEHEVRLLMVCRHEIWRPRAQQCPEVQCAMKQS